MSDVGSNSDTGSHTHDSSHPSSGIEGHASLVEGNPWFSLCASRLSALDDPKIPLLEVKDRFEQELRWIEEARSVIKSRLNMLCPIARLSPEVLAHVFRCLTDIDRPIFHEVFSLASIGWIRASHVCRSWKNVALDYPDLWGRGNICSPPRWIDERLRRSKETSFDVFLFTDEEVPPAVLATVHRMRKVSISPLFQYANQDLSANASHLALLTSSTPSLASFSYKYINHQSPGNHLKLPDNIFACNAPRLTDLWLENTTFTFHPSVFDNLVHLYLKYRNSSTGRDEDMPLKRYQLLGLLLRIPKLETLVLEGKLHNALEDIESQSDVDDHRPDPASNSSVPLPRLETLALGHDPWSWLWLMEQLSIPATTSLWVHCRVGSVMQDQAILCDAFLPFMIRHLTEKDYSRSTRSLMVICGPQAWRLTMFAGRINNFPNPVNQEFVSSETWTPTLPVIFRDTVSAPIDFSFFSSSQAPVIPVVQVLRPLLAKIYTSNIIVLQVRGTASHLDFPEWLRLFASFTALEHLSIYGIVASNLMQALGLDLTLNLGPTPVLQHTSSPGEQVLFPNLCMLELAEVDFTRFIDAADALLSEITTAALTERHEMNKTLKDIRLLDCRFRRHWINGLRNIGFRCNNPRYNDDFCRLYDHDIEPPVRYSI